MTSSLRPCTWRALLADTTTRVGERPAARWLCEVASGADRIEDVLDERATRRMVAHLDSMLARHAAGEPLAYVLGRWAFRHLDLAVDRRVLIPRPETEVVAGIAVDLARARPVPVTVADLGTGSGAIGLALADELPVAGGDGVARRRRPRCARRRPGQPRRHRAPGRQRAHRRGLVVRRPARRHRASTSPWRTRRTWPPTRPSSTRPSGAGSRRTPSSPAPTASPRSAGSWPPRPRWHQARGLAGARDRRRSGTGSRGAAPDGGIRRHRDPARPRRPRPSCGRPPPVIWAGSVATSETIPAQMRRAQPNRTATSARRLSSAGVAWSPTI